ncbi:hypothetical protein [Streptomyces showdoensis]|uniref:Gram-positive cocci surface proteins LPxTG domain-containing protein n=1 Tax=Streptomyces showdoensis TaxID=68268 RepID=A0A2P2GEW3_STREW|nr:hypothetical protein [Streptomyces showdoensis]KKZ69325.1 hypothetical protein VO63_34830 [Streptomyces showdoensis]
MRLRNALALAALTTAAAVPVAHALAPVPAVAAPPECGAGTARDFPLAARIQDGPAAYAAGGDFRAWNLDLANTTAQPCRGIHPVLVLADRGRVLRPEQIRAEFYDAGARLWRPVTFEGTDRAENVGVFGGAGEEPEAPAAASAPTPGATLPPGTTPSADPADPTSPPALTPPPAFTGFAVPAHGILTVPVRLAFRADTAPDQVVVNAAVVQRRGDDGDWVGESGDYTLTVGPADPTDPTDPAPRRDPAPADPARPTPPGAAPVPVRPELAHTGRESALRAAPASLALLGAGAALVLLARRHRTGRAHRHA